MSTTSAMSKVIDFITKIESDIIPKQGMLEMLEKAKEIEILEKKLAYIKGQEDREKNIFNTNQFDICI
jgi:hypothetical protein